MSNTRPYLVTVGGGESSSYMVNASTQGQALRIVAGGYPAPILNAKPASANEVVQWARAGKPIFDKDDFVAKVPMTIVAYVDIDGAIVEAPPLSAGFYYLHVEDFLPAQQPESGEPDKLESLQVAGEQQLAASVDDDAADVVEAAIQAAIEDGALGDGAAAAEAVLDTAAAMDATMDGAMDGAIEEPNAADYLDSAADALPDAEGEPADAKIAEPQYRGGFEGDVHKGDPANPDRATHVWRKRAWHAYEE